jgi:hypothetical protein
MTDDQILTDLLAREGGYVNHPADRGGPTHHGITLATLSRWRGRDATVEDVKDLTEYEAREIYRALYLQPFDGIDPELKPQVVDIAVNSGVQRARTLLAKAEQQTARPVATQLVIERLEYYASLVRANPSQAAFILGWVRRACTFLALALLAGGCVLKHPIQPIAPDYTVPQQWARQGCRPRGDMYHGLPVLTCPDGLRMVDKHGKEVEFVTWDEIRGKQ